MAVQNGVDVVTTLRRRAIEHHEAGREIEAVRDYRRYLEAVPGDAAIWARLALAVDGEGTREAAIECLRRALDIDPGNPDYMNNLGIILVRDGGVDEALQVHRRMIALRPDSATMRFNYGATLRACGHIEEALAAFDLAIRDAPQNPYFQIERALALLLLGRYEEGFAAYEWRGRIGRIPEPPTKAARWRGEDLAGKRLLIYPDQGLGDSLMISRLFPLLKERGATVVLYCNPPLGRLFTAAEGVDEVVEMGSGIPEVDLCCPIMSLPHLLSTTVATIPTDGTLAADPNDVAAWRKRLRGHQGMRVGLVWAGNPKQKNDHNRTLAFERLGPLLATPGVRFFSLQRDKRPGDEDALTSAAEITDLGPELTDFKVTAAVISALDLVISVDTSVAHLAGALGAPVWVLLCFAPDWRWLLHREDSPWHSSARLFRQPAVGNWDSVVRSVQRELVTAAKQESVSTHDRARDIDRFSPER